MRRLTLLTVLFAVMANVCHGQEASSSTFERFMEQWMAHDAFKVARIGVCVQDLNKGDILYANLPNVGFATGSTMKAITTAAALTQLGPSFAFETSLFYTGAIDGSGALFGDIVIKGGGDPTLGANDFELVVNQWVASIKGAGITRINGRIIADASFFDGQMAPATWIWEDLGNYYGAGAGGLNIRKNTYDLYLKPNSQIGSDVSIINTYPELPGQMRFLSEVQTAPLGTGDQTYIFGAPYTEFRTLRGTIPIGKEPFRIKGSIPDPALFSAFHLHKALKDQSVAIEKPPTAYPHLINQLPSEEMTPLLQQNSVGLLQMAKETNHESINLYAEALFKMLGKAKTGEPSIDGGKKAVTKIIAEAGIPTDGLFIEDGSGLSPYNLISPMQAVGFLTFMGRSNLAPAYFETLPISGKSGTLRHMSKGRPAYGAVNAKSGYIKRVRAYMGYATTKSGRKVAFFVSVNNFIGDYKDLTSTFEDFFDALVTSH